MSALETTVSDLMEIKSDVTEIKESLNPQKKKEGFIISKKEAFIIFFGFFICVFILLFLREIITHPEIIKAVYYGIKAFFFGVR